MTMLRTKKDIKSWLDEHYITDYKINTDLTVDVESGVHLYCEELTLIPVQFNRVRGSFNCARNQLTSLLGAPKIVDGDFHCEQNALTSLKNGPIQVVGDFYCTNNLLTSLVGCPRQVSGSFYCYANNIESLEFCPDTVGGYFYAENNPDLNQYQFAYDFTIIKTEHLRIQAVLQEKAKLDELIHHPKAFLGASFKI